MKTLHITDGGIWNMKFKRLSAHKGTRKKRFLLIWFSHRKKYETKEQKKWIFFQIKILPYIHYVHWLNYDHKREFGSPSFFWNIQKKLESVDRINEFYVIKDTLFPRHSAEIGYAIFSSCWFLESISY